MYTKMLYLFLVLLMTACAAPPAQATYPTNTLDPIQAYVNANSSQGTAVAAIATAEYFSNQLTATVEMRSQIATDQAFAIQSTQQAGNALATERAWNATTTANSVQTTAMAVGTASAMAQQTIWTQRAIDITSTADTASVQAFATQQYAIARNEELTLQRKELMNNVAAIVPWASLIFVVALLAVVFIRWSRVRVIQRDQRGDAPLLLNIVDGVTYDADRNPLSTAGLFREDIKLLPQLTSSDYAKVTARDQMLDLATRGFPHSPPRNRLTQDVRQDPLLQTQTSPQIQVINAMQAKPLFQDVMPTIVRDAVEAEIISDQSEGETK